MPKKIISSVRLLKDYFSRTIDRSSEFLIPIINRITPRTHTIVLILLTALYIFYRFALIYKIHEVPVDRPYLVFDNGDEVFAINAGINALKKKGDPVFYNYGGTSVYPYTLAFGVYEIFTGKKARYWWIDGTDYAHFPYTGKIVPVKVVYIVKQAAFILFLIFNVVFVAAFTFLLAPIVFLPKTIAIAEWFRSDYTASYYQMQMLPETHVIFFAAMCAIFFFKSVLSFMPREKFKWAVACAVAASLGTAAKISAAYLYVLPLSLLPAIIKEKYFTRKRATIFFMAAVFPYIIVNPATVISPIRYIRWMKVTLGSANTAHGRWMLNIRQLSEFLDSFYLFNKLSHNAIIFVIVLASIILARKDLYAFGGFLLLCLSSVKILNSTAPMIYTRYLAFLTLPFQIFMALPLVVVYQKLTVKWKIAITTILLVMSIVTFPYKNILRGYEIFIEGKFIGQRYRDARDEFAEFVKNNNAIVYFFDFHVVSMPYTIENQIIPFMKITELPQHLNSNEYIGYVYYKSSYRWEYNNVIGYLNKKYQLLKTFGDPSKSSATEEHSPVDYVVICLLK